MFIDQQVNHIGPLNQQLIDHLASAIRNMRYGSIEITVHDSRIVQIERKEKWRVDRER